jgi:glycosyltransferase involved in cell wall biosynthesis
MKILRIIRSVNPEGGGPIEGLMQISQYMQNLGHSVEILSLDAAEAKYVKSCPFRVYAMGPGKGIYGYHKNFIPWLTLHSHNYDVFIINGIWQYHSFAAHYVLKKQHKPYFVYTHGMLDPWFKQQYPLKHLKKWLYWPWGEFPVLRDAKKVLFTCEVEKVLARQSFWLYRCNEQVVNYGTAGHQGDAELQKQLFLTSYPQLKAKKFLLFLSRIHPKKGVDMLITAFAKLSIEYPELQLVIAGPDQLGWKKELEQLAKACKITHRITWTGMLSGDLKWGAYLSADAFILPSHQENFGIVVAEALSCSLPVLISNKVNIWQEIQASKAGLIAENTFEGCINLINEWQIMQPLNTVEMRHNAKVCFMQHFEIERATRSLLNVLAH